MPIPTADDRKDERDESSQGHRHFAAGLDQLLCQPGLAFPDTLGRGVLGGADAAQQPDRAVRGSQGQIDDRAMLEIIGTPLKDGGAMNELTVFQMVMVPETGMLWLRVIGGAGWTQIDLSGFLHG